jgi:hypothetical protein
MDNFLKKRTCSSYFALKGWSTFNSVPWKCTTLMRGFLKSEKQNLYNLVFALLQTLKKINKNHHLATVATAAAKFLK